MKHFYKFILVLFSLVLTIGSVNASELYFGVNSEEFAVGEIFEVGLFLNTDHQRINAVEGKVEFPDSMELTQIRDGGSIVNFWIKKKQEEENLQFAGITPGGYTGTQGHIFSLLFVATEPGQITINVNEGKALLNDSLGSETELRYSPLTLNIEEKALVVEIVLPEDVTPPETFTPEITEDPNIYDGQNVLMFSTQDKGSGMKYFEVYESKKKIKDFENVEWVKAESPYLLEDQGLESYVYIKAVDNDGNGRIEIVPPEHKILDLGNLLPLAILLAIILVVLLFWKRKNNMKKALLIVVVALFLLPLSAFAVVFPDVTRSTNYENSILWMTNNGVINGYPDGTFKPDDCVNRAEFLKMILLTRESSLSDSAVNPFPDVDPSQWYYPYVMTAYQNGVIDGYPDGTFKPGNCVNRVEAIKMAVLEFNDGEVPQFDLEYGGIVDAYRSLWYWDYLDYALSANVLGMLHITEIDSERFAFFPSEDMSRKEVAELLYRTKAIEDSGVDLYEEEILPDPIQPEDPYLGEEDASLEMVVFSDYECPYCKKFHDEIFPVIKENYVDTGKLKLIYRDFPLNFHSGALDAALAANCAFYQGDNDTFLTYQDLLYANNDLSVDALVGYAEEVELDTDEFTACLENQDYLGAIEHDKSVAETLGVNGTPYFYIDGELVAGAQPYSVFEDLFEQILE